VLCLGRACDKQTRDALQSSRVTGLRSRAVITLQTVWLETGGRSRSWNKTVIDDDYWVCTLYGRYYGHERYGVTRRRPSARCSCLLTIGPARLSPASCSTTTRRLSICLSLWMPSRCRGVGSTTSFRPGTCTTSTTAPKSKQIQPVPQLREANGPTASGRLPRLHDCSGQPPGLSFWNNIIWVLFFGLIRDFSKLLITNQPTRLCCSSLLPSQCQCQCQSNIYIAPKVEGRIWGAGVWVTRRDMQKRKGEI